VLPSSKLRPGVDRATAFTSVCINTALYLPWLVSQCLKNGVVLKRSVFNHICDAAGRDVHHSGSAADLVINCTGLSAGRLGGVEDKSVFPIRGQTVLVRNEADAMHSISGNDDSPDEMSYIMTRAAGGGTILGGYWRMPKKEEDRLTACRCYQTGSWESQPDLNLAIRIMKRAVALCPELTGGRGIEHLDVIRHGVGLRPGREGGTRIESEGIEGLHVVHSYGHGGGGYQSSYGCAEEVVRLVDGAFDSGKARI
jgi:D-amino-acid oxidase